MKTIAIIDYGMGNLNSVVKAIEYVAPNDKVIISSDQKVIDSADKIIFPGQGAAKNCMQSIIERNIKNLIIKNSADRPFLGICMGMQVLMENSDENNGTECLGLIEGDVKKFSSSKKNNIKIPHMGWNKIINRTEHPIWNKINQEAFFYFVHSFYVNPKDKSIIIGETKHGEIFCSVFAKNNIIAIQGHPEKSSDTGLQFLKNFIGMK